MPLPCQDRRLAGEVLRPRVVTLPDGHHREVLQAQAEHVGVTPGTRQSFGQLGVAATGLQLAGDLVDVPHRLVGERAQVRVRQLFGQA